MNIDHSYRYRVSSNLIGIKIIIGVLLVLGISGIILSIVQQQFKPGALMLCLLALLLYLLIKDIKIVDYNSINHILYVTDTSKDEMQIIPVENIDSIKVKGYAYKWSGFYYVITYRDEKQQVQKARFFPIPFRNDVETIAIDTTRKNPNAVMDRWGMG